MPALLVLMAAVAPSAITAAPAKGEDGNGRTGDRGRFSRSRGVISVGPPRIVTRERLVNDRLMQEEWLKKQLAASDDAGFGFQGAIDYRTLFAVSMSTGVQADEFELERYEAESEAYLDSLRRKEELAAIEHEIALANKRKVLEDAAPGAEASATTASTGTSTPAPSPPAATKPTNPKLAGGDVNDLSTRLTAENRAKLLPSPDSIATASKVKASPLEEFRDRLAFREEIRNEILESQLDDAHDLAGRTLYRLNFDVTVRPATASEEAFAVVSMTLEEAQKPEDLYDTWIRELSNKLNNWANEDLKDTTSCLDAAINDREVGSCIPALEELARFAVSQDFVHPLVVEARRRAAKDVEEEQGRDELQERARATVLRSLDQIDANVLGLVTRAMPTEDENRLMNPAGAPKELASDIKAFARALGPSLRAPAGQEEADGLRYLLQAKAIRDYFVAYGLDSYADRPEMPITGRQRLSAMGKEAKREAFATKLGSIRAMAYGATPKEVVQRVSDVASRRSVAEFAAAAAMLSGSASVDTTLKLIRESQHLLQGIARAPLVVGFTDASGERAKGSPNFGWLIGPKFRLTRSFWPWSKGFEFSHTPIQNTVAATLAVPAWWDSAKVTVCTRWATQKRASSKSPEKCSPEYEVALPGNPEAIWDVFYPPSRRPKSQAGTVHFAVVSGEPADLLIRGDNLWRSTTVTLGGQLADRIRVLPGGGIVASFDKVSERPALGESPAPRAGVPIVVWTSEGVLDVGEATIHPPLKPKPRVVKVSLSTPRIVDQGRIVLAMDQGELPAGFFAATVGIRQRDRGTGGFTPWRSSAATAIDKRIEADFKADQFEKRKAGEEVQVRLQVQLRASAGAGDIEAIAEQLAIFYPEAKDTHIAVPETIDANGRLKLTFPPKADVAFPGLDRATAVTATVKGGQTLVLSGDWKRDSEVWEFSAPVPGVKKDDEITLALVPEVPDLKFQRSSIKVK
jgi:hypothetical protein